MSVINKMLRDLDARKSSAAPDSVPAGAGVRPGTHALGDRAVFSRQAPHGRGRYWVLASVVMLAGLAAAFGWWQMQGLGRSGAVGAVAQVAQGNAPKVAAPAAMVPPPAPAPQVLASAPGIAASAAATPEAVAPAAVAPASAVAAAVVPASAVPMATVPTSAVPTSAAPIVAAPIAAAAAEASPALPVAGAARIDNAQPPATSIARAPTARVEAPAAKKPSAPPGTSNIALRMETAMGLRSRKEPAAARTTATTASDSARLPSTGGTAAHAPVTTATAAQEALAQAQTLWAAGSRDAAVELVRDAVAIAERSGAGGSAGLIPLVRELTRMQLAEGHYGAVWDLLTRLETHLGNQADLWAIRANAAQRLGRHQDSVHAYMVALQSRPTEQRWLLGSAVSLAALGQTSSAAEMADKARAAGPISKDVQAYLRQMNVPVRD